MNFNKTYKIIINNYFFRKFIRRFHYYIYYYYECNINQIKCHAKYNSLIFIIESLILYYIIIINFILTLLKMTKKINVIISIICKFFKRIIFIFDKNIFLAKD